MESRTPSGLVVMSLRIHRQRLQKSLLQWLNRAQTDATVSAKTFCMTNKHGHFCGSSKWLLAHFQATMCTVAQFSLMGHT